MANTNTTANSTGFYEVPNYLFKMVLDTQQALSTKIRKATTPAAELKLTGKAYLCRTGDTGFAIQADGELVAVYSRVAGQGANIMQAAISLGANRLDCFDGYLVEFYSKHGFIETDRAANWTAGEPDVVFMKLAE